MLPLRVGWQVAPAMVVFPVAIARGFDREFGVQMERSDFVSGPQLNEALASGQVDVANLSILPALTAFQTGVPARAVLGRGWGPDVNALIVRPESGIQSVKDLVGKKVALTVGSSANMLMWAMARVEGIALDRVQVINMNNDDIPAALSTGQVDAAATWEPNVTVWLDKGLGKVLFRGTGYVKAGQSVVALRDEIIEKRNEDGYRFVLALVKAMHFIRNDKTGEAIDIAAKEFKMDRDVLARSVKPVVFDPRFTQRYWFDDLEQMSQFLLDARRIKDMPDAKQFSYGAYLDRAQREHPELFADLPAVP